MQALGYELTAVGAQHNAGLWAQARHGPWPLLNFSSRSGLGSTCYELRLGWKKVNTAGLGRAWTE